MSEKNNNDFKKFHYENPFKKKIILEKVNKPGPVVQKLIIHHKKNLRKSLIYSSKEDFDKENIPKEKSQDLNENAINKKKRNIIIEGDKVLDFGDLLIKKGEYPEDIKSQIVENDNGKKKNQNNNRFFYSGIEIKEEAFEKNPFKANSQNYNPFKMNNIVEKEISNNPFKNKADDKINKYNPFMNLLKDSNKNDINNMAVNNPFKVNENNSVSNDNPFANNKSGIFGKNPFLEKNTNNKNINNENSTETNPFKTNDLTNPFTANPINLKNESTTKEKTEEDEENQNVEEEVKIEKDENKLKNLKEVQYSQTEKFYETEIENLQYLEHGKDKNRYISIGGGTFNLQEEKDENGKKVGIFIVRESSTKSIKLKGIVINSTSVEKAKLKSGLEFIFIKNILVKYSKYNPDKISEETKITFLRIRINKDEIDNFYNKTNEFFNLFKK